MDYLGNGVDMIAGERVVLREIEEDDLDLIVKWRNDPEVLKWLFSYLPISNASQRQWYEKYLAEDKTQTFIIEVKDGRVPIGTIGINEIDHRNQRGELGILIGENSYRGKGLGEESLRLMINYAFDQMNLRKIKALVFNDNRNAIILYEKCGFKHEGILKQEVYKEEKFKDVCIMGIIKQ